MEYITPVNNYVVLMPDGDLKGFKEVDEARGYIYEYFYRKTLEAVHSGSGDYYFEMYTQMNDVGIINGVEEGECQIYILDDFMDKIRNSGLFQEEKDMVISHLLQENINLNVYNLGLYDILSNVDVEWA